MLARGVAPWCAVTAMMWRRRGLELGGGRGRIGRVDIVGIFRLIVTLHLLVGVIVVAVFGDVLVTPVSDPNRVSSFSAR